MCRRAHERCAMTSNYNQVPQSWTMTFRTGLYLSLVFWNLYVFWLFYILLIYSLCYYVHFKHHVDIHISSPSGARAPASSASPSSTRSHRGWGRRAAPCTSTCSRCRSWRSPPCRSPPRGRCRSAAAGRRPCSAGAWCTCSGSRSPRTSSGPAPSPRRSEEAKGKGILSRKCRRSRYFEQISYFTNMTRCIPYLQTHIMTICIIKKYY